MLPIHGTVVIGEGERDEAPMLYIGEEVGTRTGPKVDIALDPLEGTTIAAKNLPNALAVIAIAEEGSLLNAPDVYMDKIAIGPGYPSRAGRSRRAAGREHQGAGRGQGRAGQRDHGLRPRPAAPCPDDRGGARDRRRDPADRRRRRRRHHPHHQPGRDRHRHLSRHRRRAGRACSPRRRSAASAARCRGGW